MNTKRRAHCQLWHDWKERIIRIGDEQTSLQNQFDNFRNEYSEYPPRIEALEADVNALDGRVIIAETDIADAENRISECENDIDRIDAELVDKTGEINNLSNRMTLAEADIDDIDARLEGIETGEILLSQLNVDADKDMGGKALTNVKINANEVRINGANIDRTRQNEILLYDMQTEIESGTLNIKNPNYTIVTENDLTAPYSKVVETNDKFGSHFNGWGEYIPVIPGERIHIEGWINPVQIFDDSYGYFTIRIGQYDKNKKPIGIHEGRAGGYFDYRNMELNKWHKVSASVVIPTSHTPFEGSDGGPVRYIRIMYGVNGAGEYPNNDTVKICGIKYYRDAKYITDIQAKVATFDGVVIADGGTVDGVDISTHAHDGTAVGGPKINLDNVEVTAVKDMGGHGLRNVKVIRFDSMYPMRFSYPGYHDFLVQLFSNNIAIAPSISVEGDDWDLSKAVRIYANGTKEINGPLTHVTSINGVAIDVAKAAEWDGKARPPAYKQYYNPNLTTPTTEYLELSDGRQAFIPMRVGVHKLVGTGDISIYAIFDDSSELLLLRISGSTTNAFRMAHEIAEILGNGNKSGRIITRFKIVQAEEGTGTARIDAYEY